MTGEQSPELSSLRDPESVRQAVLAALPDPAAVRDVQDYGARQGLECSVLTGDIVYCSVRTRRRLRFTRSVWLLEFRFQAGVLQDLSVTEGLTGP
jgi:hypothetical protein